MNMCLIVSDRSVQHHLGAKGLGPVNLIRLGVLYGSGGRILTSPRFGATFFCLPEAPLVLWLDDIKSSLAGTPSGPFMLISKVFGLEVAIQLRNSGEFPQMAASRVAAMQESMKSSLAISRSGVLITSNPSLSSISSSSSSSSKHSLDDDYDLPQLSKRGRRD